MKFKNFSLFIIASILIFSTIYAQENVRLLKNIRTDNAGSEISGALNVNGTIYFSASDGVNGIELWKTNGINNATMVKNIYQANGNSLPRILGNINDTVFFTATDSLHGRELWKSDGTSEGTVLVEDITPGTSPTQILGLLYDLNGVG